MVKFRSCIKSLQQTAPLLHDENIPRNFNSRELQFRVSTNNWVEHFLLAERALK